MIDIILSESTKKQVLALQNYCCNYCNRVRGFEPKKQIPMRVFEGIIPLDSLPN